MKRSVKIILTIGGFILFFVSAFTLFGPNNGITGFVVYSPSLAIINYDNNQPLNSDLDVLFITNRKNDLIVNVLDGNTEIIKLKCGDKVLNPDSNIFRDYECKENSILTIKILSKKLDLELQFGNTRQIVKNIV